MLTKEHTAVLPFLLLLTDYFWNPGFSLTGIKRNWRLYLPFTAGLALGLLYVLRILRVGGTAGFHVRGLPWYAYFFTECRVLWDYLRLFVVPIGQNLDPQVEISGTILDHGAIFGLIALAAVTVLAWIYRRRFPLASYGWFVFLILIAPTSSFVPIRDPMAERRLYLPFIGLLFITVEFLRRWKTSRNSMIAVLSAVLLVEGVFTYQRNELWASAIDIWNDTVAKSPGKVRPRYQLAYVYYQAGQCSDAAEQYGKTAELSNRVGADLLLDWALAYDCAGRSEDALAKLKLAAERMPNAHIYSQLGMEYGKMGRYRGGVGGPREGAEEKPAFRHDLFLSRQYLQHPRQPRASYRRVPARVGVGSRQSTRAGRFGPSGRSMIRIGVNALYLIPGGVGGTEIYLRNLLTALGRRRFRRTITWCSPIARRMPIWFRRQPNFTCEPQPVRASFRPARILWEQIALPLGHPRHRLDVLFNPGFTAPLFCGCPMVTVFHDLQHKRHPEYFRWFDLPFWRLLLWASAQRSRALIADSEATAGDIRALLPSRRLEVIHHGVEPAFLRDRDAPRAEGLLLCVSTLHPHKNLERLLRVTHR